MPANQSIQTYKTYVEMMVRYRIWSICAVIVLCSVIWFSQAESSNRLKIVSAIGVLFAIGWAGTFVAVPLLNRSIGQMEEADKKKGIKKNW
ncbi:MAG: hypothetical protein JST89_10625 [Cyanobacteria bacterium SZAS-4]|nr:hypothetical protein [Cyanobacteria bacterium SZAS-4]